MAIALGSALPAQAAPAFTFDAGTTTTLSGSQLTLKNNTSNISVRLVADSGFWQKTNDGSYGLSTSFSGDYGVNDSMSSSGTITMTVDTNNDGTFGDAFKISSLQFGDPTFSGGNYTFRPNGSATGQETQDPGSAGSTPTHTFSSTNFDGVTSVVIVVSSSAFGIMLDNLDIVAASPIASTGSASSITAAGATLNGTVADNGATTSVSFDYGTTTGYGTNVAATTGGTVAAGAGATAASVAIGSLSCNTLYHFRVKGVSSAGTTNGSDNVFTTSACVPGAPTGVSASAGDAQAAITFTAPASNGGGAIATYTATASPGGATGTCAGPGACSITVTGLSNGTAYTFTVTATNSAGTGAASAASNSVTPKANQTITFANPGTRNFGTTPTLTASATSGLTVSFSSSTAGVCTITSGGALTFLTAGSCTINADQAGNGSYSAATTVSQTFTVAAVVPGAPTIGTATAGDTQASVTFTTPSSNGGASITSYVATANPGGATGTGASSPVTVTGLTNGTAYTFTVTATNSAGTGAASAASNSVTPKASQTITFANPGAQNFGTTPTLTATSDSSLTVSFTSSTSGVCTITSGGALTFVAPGTCTINADQAGNGAFLAATQVSRSFTVNAVVPGAPTNASASPGDTLATVSFTAPAFNGGASITGYTVTSNPAGLNGTGAASPITVPGLTNGTAYTFTVTATNSAGTGFASAASNSVTPNPGPAVVSVAVPANGTYTAGQNLDFTVTWDSNATVTGTPRLALVIGATTVQANYVSSPTATTTLFRYTVLAGQNDSDGITIGALTLNGGTIRNGSGTDATLTLNSVASTSNVLVNTVVGVCGTANGVTTAFAPAANLCSVGSPTSVLGGSTAWTWSCTSGGGNASCSAPKQSTATATGKGSASVAATNSWVLDSANSSGFIPLTGDPKSPSVAPPAGVTFPHGLLDFKLVAGTPGSAATVTITYPTALPAGTVYWKFGPEAGNLTPHWYQFPGAVISNDRLSITLTITDGAQGDSDLAANGSITDPGGPGFGGTGAEGIPTLSTWGLIGLSGLMGLAMMAGMRRRRVGVARSTNAVSAS